MHLSYSQISMYVDCGKRYQAHYKQDLKSPEGEALLVGTLVHGAAEKFVVDHTVDMAKVFTAGWQEAMKKPNYKNIVWDDTPAAAYAAGLRICRSDDVLSVLSAITPAKYLKTIEVQNDATNETSSTQIEVPAVEREIHWNLEDMPDIIGYIDCIQDDGVPIDFKTAGKMWAGDKASKEMQPLFYLAALEQLGEHDHKFRFRHIVMTKAQNPRIEIFEEQRSAEEIETLELIVRKAWEGIAMGYFGINPTSWACDPRFCGAYYLCVGKGK